jgi:hypothetical protein
MILQCPKCKSIHIKSKNYARKVGGTIGAIAGTIGGLSAIGYGARTGASAGLIFGPFGATVGGISGAILAGLAGGAAGSSAGLSLGELVDSKILNNLKCTSCHHSFSVDDHGIPRGYHDYSDIDEYDDEHLIEQVS